MNLLDKIEEISLKILLGLSVLIVLFIISSILIALFSISANGSALVEYKKRTNKYEVNCKIHKIYCQIIRNNPNINKKYAMKLSNIIHNKSIKYKINSRLLTAILAQETMYKMIQGSCSTGFVKIDSNFVNYNIPSNMKEKLNHFTNTPITICEDFGIGQINYKNIQNFKIDKHRLLNDLDYSVDKSAFMLKMIRKYYKDKDPNWFTRYNAYTPSKRKLYRKLVEEYF